MNAFLDKMIAFFRTETPMIGSISKFLLASNGPTQDYVNAVSKEKKGEDAIVHVNGKTYRLVRAGAYHTKK